jgi:membrane-bound ClpP family serine protease
MFGKKLLFWTPRVLSALLALFFLSFTLEAFTPGFGWQDGLSHLIIGILIVGITVFAWKKPKIGGLFFILVGGIFLILVRENTVAFWITGLVPVVTGLFFYLSEGKKEK